MRELRRQSISVSLPPEATSSGAHRIVTIRASRVDRGANEQSFTERVQTAIKSIGGKSDGRTLDVSNERAIHTFFTELGAFDHLVFTAGDSLHLQDLASTDLKQAGRAFELRYWSAYSQGGSVVLTTGIAGLRPQKGWVVAASVCGTIEALTRALAIELAPIRVNAVSPGVVRTNLWHSMSATEREEFYGSLSKSLPVGRVGEAHDIAQAYVFLMQEGFATGQILVVDGGTVLV